MTITSDITASARVYGYGLLGSARIDVPRPIEDVVLGLMHEESSARLAEGVAVMCFRGKPNYCRIADCALANGTQNEIGYLLAGVRYVFQNHNVAYDPALDAAVEKLYAVKTDAVGVITRLPVPDGLRIWQEMQTVEEKKWNVLGGPAYLDMEKKFMRFTT